MSLVNSNKKCSACSFKSFAVSILNDDELLNLGQNCVEVRFKKGETIFKQGTFLSHVIFIKTGLIKLHINSSGIRDHILKIQQAPSYLGLVNFFGDNKNHFSATCLEDTTACMLKSEYFSSLIKTNGEFAFEIIKDISKDELNYFNKYINRNQKHINGRLAETLLNFKKNIYRNDHFSLPLSRDELSAIIGASRESTIRELQAMANHGIIAIKGKQVTILDESRLERISNNG